MKTILIAVTIILACFLFSCCGYQPITESEIEQVIQKRAEEAINAYEKIIQNFMAQYGKVQ